MEATPLAGLAEKLGFEVVERPGLAYGELRWRDVGDGKWYAARASWLDRKMWDGVRALAVLALGADGERGPFDTVPGLEGLREGTR